MNLVELQISNLRNLDSARLSFHPRFNIISGANGSGKTSFLEALYLLGTGYSFRTRDISALVSHGKDKLTVFAKTADFEHISIQKAPYTPTVALLNGEPCQKRSELAAFLPCQIFYQDIFQFLDAGPGLRRGLLDWGLFHVEPAYHSVWKDYRRILKQRNSLLKQKINASGMEQWNILLTDFASQLDAMRKNYFTLLSCEFNLIVNQLSDLNATLEYYRGWDKKNEGKSLETILRTSFSSDCLRQYTHYGAHHADLTVCSEDSNVKKCFSRGQQKIVLFALKFAQAKLFNKSCLFLIDDLTAELDENHIQRVITYLTSLKGQVFITARNSELPLLDLMPGNYTHYGLENSCFKLQDVSRETRLTRDEETRALHLI